MYICEGSIGHAAVFLIVLFITLYNHVHSQRCVPLKNCHPPECRCKEQMPPTTERSENIPQMVLFTFDDAVRNQDFRWYKQLFAPVRKNPNGCPICMTLFLQDKYTNYDAVRELHNYGMEIAVHSVSHRVPASFWQSISRQDFVKEACKQKQNIHDKAGVPLEKIKGWRSPYLQPSGETQYSVLQACNFTYDSTLTIQKTTLKSDTPWPFTLDFGWPLSCGVPPCPRSSYPGFWMLPVVSLVTSQKTPAVYVDAYRPNTIQEGYDFLWSNFQSYYTRKRTPFMLNMHSAWFTFPNNLEAMDMFIQKLITLPDVYIITSQQAIDWMKNPVSLTNISHLESWGCPQLNPQPRVPMPMTTTTMPPSITFPQTTTLSRTTSTITSPPTTTLPPTTTTKELLPTTTAATTLPPTTTTTSTLPPPTTTTTTLPPTTTTTTTLPLSTIATTLPPTMTTTATLRPTIATTLPPTTIATTTLPPTTSPTTLPPTTTTITLPPTITTTLPPTTIAMTTLPPTTSTTTLPPTTSTTTLPPKTITTITLATSTSTPSPPKTTTTTLLPTTTNLLTTSTTTTTPRTTTTSTLPPTTTTTNFPPTTTTATTTTRTSQLPKDSVTVIPVTEKSIKIKLEQVNVSAAIQRLTTMKPAMSSSVRSSQRPPSDRTGMTPDLSTVPSGTSLPSTSESSVISSPRLTTSVFLTKIIHHEEDKQAEDTAALPTNDADRLTYYSFVFFQLALVLLGVMKL